MIFTAPVSSLMTSKLITVSALDKMTAVKEVFDRHLVHHVLVVRYKKLVGLISKTDYDRFLKCKNAFSSETLTENAKLNTYAVEDVMTKGLATLASTDRINVALQIFAENRLHAIPIVDNDEVVGILTTNDIIKALWAEDEARITEGMTATPYEEVVSWS